MIKEQERCTTCESIRSSNSKYCSDCDDRNSNLLGLSIMSVLFGFLAVLLLWLGLEESFENFFSSSTTGEVLLIGYVLIVIAEVNASWYIRKKSQLRSHKILVSVGLGVSILPIFLAILLSQIYS